MIPQARLQPSAPMSMVRISVRPASATLSEPVKVRTMMSPNRTSDTRSCGSSTRLDEASGFSAINRLTLVRRPRLAFFGEQAHAAGGQFINGADQPDAAFGHRGVAARG